MGSNKALFASLLLIILLLFTTHEELGGGDNKILLKVEARVCESKSHGFRGQCWSDHNCRLVCGHEGFPGGKCHGFRKRCFCSRPC